MDNVGIYRSEISGSKVVVTYRELERDNHVVIQPPDEIGVELNLDPAFVAGMIEEGTWVKED